MHHSLLDALPACQGRQNERVAAVSDCQSQHIIYNSVCLNHPGMALLVTQIWMVIQGQGTVLSLPFWIWAGVSHVINMQQNM